MSLLGLGTALLVGAFLIVTVLSQLRRPALIRRLKRWDPIAAVPTWTFFAPNPGTTDSRVVWRDLYADGETSEWHELQPPPQRMLRCIWQPEKRVRKGIVDCSSMTLRLVARDSTSPLPRVSLPYLLIASHVSALPASPMSVARQFALLASRETDPDDPQYLELHLLSPWIRLPGVPESVPLVTPGSATAVAS